MEKNSKKWAWSIPGNLRKDINRQYTKYLPMDPGNWHSRSLALVWQKKMAHWGMSLFGKELYCSPCSHSLCQQHRQPWSKFSNMVAFSIALFISSVIYGLTAPVPHGWAFIFSFLQLCSQIILVNENVDCSLYQA